MRERKEGERRKGGEGGTSGILVLGLNLYRERREGKGEGAKGEGKRQYFFIPLDDVE